MSWWITSDNQACSLNADDAAIDRAMASASCGRVFIPEAYFLGSVRHSTETASQLCHIGFSWRVPARNLALRGGLWAHSRYVVSLWLAALKGSRCPSVLQSEWVLTGLPISRHRAAMATRRPRFRAGSSTTFVLLSCVISQRPSRLTTTKVRMYRCALCLTPSGDVKGLVMLVTVPTATS